MEFRLLGPLEVIDEEGERSLGGPKQRTVLALLALNANRVVAVDRLIDALWGTEPPETARNTVQTYIRHLRRTIGPERIDHRSSGYVLRVEPSELDLARFSSLVERARELSPSDPAGAAGALREAIVLWRGPALDDLADQPSLGPEIARLNELRLAAVEDRIDAELETGRHRQLVGELETLARQHPFRERLWGQLMVALYRSGRQADALQAFRRARTLLLDDLGVDPSHELRALERRILEQDPDLELPGEPLRGYRILERIGAGAYGVVSRALQPQVGREVAIKEIHGDLVNDPEFVRRFEREANLVARLEHPHIVPLYDYWRDPGGAFLVMRLLRGGNLRRLIDRDVPLPPADAVRVFDEIADALAAAHRQGVIHRDVKPENVLLDEDGHAYLSDFGIATDLAEPPLATVPVTRSSPYASPEQLRGDPPSPATDIYALGIVLYELLAGRSPEPVASSGARGRDPVAPLPSLRDTRPELSPAFDHVIATATRHDPADRYADARSVADAARAALGAAAAEATTDVPNPYLGLHAFDEPDAPNFFGRERQVARLLERLAETAPEARFLAIVGPSGSGKSSVVRAGVLPAVRLGALPGSDRWFVTDLVPGEHPFDELERALLRVAVDPPPDLGARLRRSERGLAVVLQEILPRGREVELFLVVDQLEELYTLAAEGERTAFIATLVDAVTDPASRLQVVTTLRADFYDAPLLDPRLGPLLAARTEAIVPLSPEELERAIAGPAERAGVALERSLVAEILADVSDQPGALPLLQYALTELFDLRREGTMALDAYRSIDGVAGAVAKRAEELYAELPDAGRSACRQLFLRLVSVDDSGQTTRRRVLRSELDTLEVDHAALAQVIETFGRHRLLAFDRDAATREPTIEVAHEALLGAWERLRGWIEEGREDVVVHRRLAASAHEWDAADRDPGFLLAGGRLERIAAWAEERNLALARREREFLRESVARHASAAEAERARVARERALERRSLRRLRALVAALSAAALVAATLTVIAVERGASAERQRDQALIAGLTGEALSSLDRDPDLSVLLSLHAVKLSAARNEPVPSATVEALHWAMQEANIEYPVADGPIAVIDGPLGTRGVYDVPLAVLANHARAHVTRSLTPHDCLRSFSIASCPGLPASFPVGLSSEPLDRVGADDPAPPLAGTTVTMWWGSHDDPSALATFREELDAFTERTGVEVIFTQDPEIESWITSRDVEVNRPDLASVTPNIAADLGRSGHATDLRAFLDVNRLRERQSPYLVRLGTVGSDGEWPAEDGALYGAFIELSVKGLIWYPAPELRAAGLEVPTTLSELWTLTDRLRRSGRTPWCFGFESGGASGWPGTDWIENLVLAEAGVDAYDAWAFHRAPFDGSPIRSAFRRLGDLVFGPGVVRGGRHGVLETSIFDAPYPLIEDPPGCWLHLQASFAAGFLPRGAAGSDTDVFPFPRGDAGATGLLGGGELMTAFSDRPEVRELMRFLLSPEHGASFAELGTGFMSPNRSFDLDIHTPFLRPVARALRAALEADTFRFDASDLMPPDIGAGLFWRSMMRYVEEGPGSLDAILTELEAAWPSGTPIGSPSPDPD